jgi:Fe-Mn family superoxide dismutase
MTAPRIHDPSRRDFLAAVAAAAAGTALAGMSTRPATADTDTSEGVPPVPTPVPAFAPVHQPRPLSFDPARLDGLSEKLIRSHWENNYGGSVKTLNAVKQKLALALADKDTPPFVYDDLKREHLMRTGSVVFHELYFDNLGGSGTAGAALHKSIGESFGDFATWETEFRKIGAGLAGGSGWVVAGYNLHTGQIENYWLPDHLHAPAATAPLLVMDMYEHSYQMDYGAAAATYIDAFFRNVRWEMVAERLKRASAWNAGR